MDVLERLCAEPLERTDRLAGVKKRSSRKVPAHLNRAVSMSSVTDSTMSLNVVTVTLNMDTVNFLGISIVGQSNKVRKIHEI